MNCIKNKGFISIEFYLLAPPRLGFKLGSCENFFAKKAEKREKKVLEA